MYVLCYLYSFVLNNPDFLSDSGAFNSLSNNRIFSVTETLLTGVVVQFPAWIAAVLGETISTNTLAGGLVQNPVGPAESQQT